MANQENIHGTAEPVNRELLWLQSVPKHRSSSLFNSTGDDGALDCRRCDWKLWQHIRSLPGKRIDERVFRYIRDAGLGGVFEAGYHKLDHALITALVERWRPETHTFHFPVGEATVTLQDVQVLWGLPIDGEVFSSIWFQDTEEGWSILILEQLGIQVENREIEGGKIKLSCLARHLEDPYENNEVSFQQRARLYILYLLGGTLFVDRTSKNISCNYVYRIIDLSRPRYYSWGTAVLACLYRNLCDTAEDSNQKCIAGPLSLLQYWAWERLPYISPICKNLAYDFTTPYAKRWDGTKSFANTPSHVVTPFRSALVAMREGQYIWCPYDAILDSLPEDCRRDRELWTYVGWMIEWSTVEPHVPNRVARQFGWTQSVPNNLYVLSPQEHMELHGTDRRGRPDYDWRIHHRGKIEYWARRHENIFLGVAGGGTTPEYMSWFLSRTVMTPVNAAVPTAPNRYPDLGARNYFFEEGFRQHHQLAQETVQMHPESQNYMQPFLDFAPRMSEYVNQPFMDYGSQHYDFPFTQYNPAPAPDAAAAFHPSNDSRSFYASSHPIFSTPVTPRGSNVGGELFNVDNATFAPDIYQAGTSTNRHGASSSRQDGAVNLGDDDNQANDDDFQRPRHSTSSIPRHSTSSIPRSSSRPRGLFQRFFRRGS